MELHSLRPDPNTHKILLSSPAKFEGLYEQENLIIAPAHAGMDNQILRTLQQTSQSTFESVVSRYYYVCAFNFIPEPEQKIVIPNYSSIGNLLCIALSIYYGKRFENHGMLESSGIYWMPRYEAITPNPNYYFWINNHEPRRDLELSLDLSHTGPVIKFLLSSDPEVAKIHRFFFTAGKFYLSSILSTERDLERAYLDLITCGEVLSNYYDYPEEEKYDESLKSLFSRLESIGANKSEIKALKSRLYQVKRRFFLTLNRLMNKKFFEKTESKQDDTKLTQDCFEGNVKAAYDLRSNYVHSGFSFSPWIEPYPSRSMNEVQLPGVEPNIDSTKLQKILKKIPTYSGLERIMRFALLRFLHTNGVHIHPELEDSQ